MPEIVVYAVGNRPAEQKKPRSARTSPTRW